MTRNFVNDELTKPPTPKQRLRSKLADLFGLLLFVALLALCFLMENGDISF